MSDFDSNPFADPRATSPFSDPSVQQAANSAVRQEALGDFNPFADGRQTRPANQGVGGIPPPQPAHTQPAIMTPSEAPPPYSQSGAQKIDTSELQRRQEELERKAEELQRKEQEMKNAQYAGKRDNNWPPLPKFLPVGPCFYQDISVDIPLEFQRIVKFAYYLWGFHVVVLLLNILGSLAFLIASSSGGTTFGLSILWFILFTPCSFVCWFRPLYKAFRSDSSFNFFVFFFIFFFQFCVYVVQCLGITDFTVGWINALSIVGSQPAAGGIMLVIAFFFTIEAVVSMMLLLKSPPIPVLFRSDISDFSKRALSYTLLPGMTNTLQRSSNLSTLHIEPRVHRIYRSSGASFQKAQAEFASDVMKNETVRGAAADAAAAGARGAVSGYGSESRY